MTSGTPSGGASRAPHDDPAVSTTIAHRTARFPLPASPRALASRSFLAVGALGVVAGGIVAAVTGPTGFERGSWVAAYLVLVVGVAQIALGAGLAWLPDEVPARSATMALLIGWNLAAVVVIAGTLVSAPVLTSVGGVITAAILVGFVLGVGHSRPELSGWALLYRALAVFVLLSTPVGLLLAWMRRG